MGSFDAGAGGRAAGPETIGWHLSPRHETRSLADRILSRPAKS
jgi:hypothetical protein